MHLVKEFHVALAFLTAAGFIARAALAMANNPLRNAKWVRIAPHVVDTLLLVLGITLAVELSLSPLTHGWLMAKIVALFVYIGFGVMTMRATNSSLRLFGFVGALASVGYIFAVAYSKQVIPF